MSYDKKTRRRQNAAGVRNFAIGRVMAAAKAIHTCTNQLRKDLLPSQIIDLTQIEVQLTEIYQNLADKYYKAKEEPHED